MQTQLSGSTSAPSAFVFSSFLLCLSVFFLLSSHLLTSTFFPSPMLTAFLLPVLSFSVSVSLSHSPETVPPQVCFATDPLFSPFHPHFCLCVLLLPCHIEWISQLPGLALLFLFPSSVFILVHLLLHFVSLFNYETFTITNIRLRSIWIVGLWFCLHTPPQNIISKTI